MTDYHSLIRKDVLRICPPGLAKKVLEIGCGTGETLAYMKRMGLAKHVTGIERSSACVGRVNPDVDAFLHMDAEQFEPNEQYSGILLLDVLEHLVEPFVLLKRLVSCLAPNGYILISIPNIRNLGILKSLIFHGEWEYQDSGILDRTHLRFFTYASFLRTVTTVIPELQLDEYASNDELHSCFWSCVLALPKFKELGVCQHLFRFSCHGSSNLF